MSAGWERIKELFAGALARPEPEQVEWLERACGSDGHLFTEVMSLLGAHEETGAFLSPLDATDDPTNEVDRDVSISTDPWRLLTSSDGALPRLADRYRVADRLGAGASGVVYRAHDELVREDVAVKVLHDREAAASPAFRREVATLRFARLPGVVAILDEGEDAGRAFIVFELVDGRPFPRDLTPWADIAPATLGLLETLERVHHAGVVHRDLKPDNVLVDGAGRATLTDLGIAWEAAWDRGAGRLLAGTPAYLAPELLDGGEPTVASDLYALGVMLFQALSGERPHPARSLEELVRTRCHRPAPRLRDLNGVVPGHVADLVDRLLAKAPERRPRDAHEALTALAADTASESLVDRFVALAAGRGAIPEEDLRPLFLGPERLHMLRTDGARVLHAATGGNPTAVASTVSAWRRTGLARWEGERLAVDRDALERIAGDALPDLGELSNAGDFPGYASRAADEADRLLRAGRAATARVWMEEGLAALRRAPENGTAVAERLLATALEIAILEGSKRGFDRAHYVAERALELWPEAEPAARLCRAADAIATGDRARALELTEAPLPSTSLDRLRLKVRMFASRWLDRDAHRSVLAAASRDGRSDPVTRSLITSARAWMAYEGGEFERAARLHRRVADRLDRNPARQASLCNAATALLDGHDWRAASALARRVSEEIGAARLPHLAARSESILVEALYRGDQRAGVDQELIDASASLAAPVQASICLTEAAVAWRAGDMAEAVTLAERTSRTAASCGLSAVVLLARGIGAACGAGDPAEAESLGAALVSCPIPGVVVQSAALLQEGGIDVPGLRDLAHRRARELPPETWRYRREVLSIDEALTLIP